jgi:ribosomal-protein-alanine N-acetyltransferase
MDEFGSRLVIEPMQERHVPAVSNIEDTIALAPWNRHTFLACLRANYQCRIALLNSDICGYCVLSVAAGEAHLLNIGVLPRVQRQGIGSRLMADIITAAQRQGAEIIFLEVRITNTGAQRLYTRFGFGEIGRRKGYYKSAKGREDAKVMKRRIASFTSVDASDKWSGIAQA